MAAEFERAPEVESFARALIPQYHTHLIEARIVYLFREGDWESKGKVTLGKAFRLSGKEQFFADADFAIVINKEVWGRLDDAQQLALVDHELCHCGSNGEDDDGNPRWTIWPHDVEEFRSIIDRHGLWKPDLKSFGEATAAKLHQATIFELVTQDGSTEEEPDNVPA